MEIKLSDINFYERKIKSLEEDNVYLHDEIMKLRARLRTAEDYEIKYDMLLTNSQRDMERLKSNLEKQQEIKRQEFLSIKIKENEEKWSTQWRQYQQKLRKQAETEVQNLKKQLQEKTQSFQSIKRKSEEIELFGFKMGKIEKENQNLKEQFEQMKKFYENQRSEEISKLRSALNHNYREKIENEKKKYEEKIIDLENRLNQLQIQDDNVNYQVSEATNRQLASFKKLFDSKSEEHSKEVQNLRNLLNNKNEEIKETLKAQSLNNQRHQNQLNDKNEYINQLQNRIIQREKQHQNELVNLVERLKAIKDEQHQELKAQIDKLNDEIVRSHDLWKERILNHENQIDELNRQFQDERRRLIQEKNLHKRKCSQMSLRMKESQAERDMGDTQMLINSLRDMDGKENNMGSYENGITFLERQYKKVQLKLEEKSRLVSKLSKEINDIRAETDKEVAQLKERMKKDKKENGEKILFLENQLKDVTQNLKNKEKQVKKKERQLQKQNKELQEKFKALKELNEQITRDYNRVIQDKKSVEASYREQRQKSFASRTDLNVIKKQKWLELQKQKNQLEIIFKEKQQQLKIGFEQQLDQKSSQLNRLKQDYEITRNQNEILIKENQKMLIALEANKENSKMAEYNKKMASLNLQIAVTQNLYETLVNAKSRVNIFGSQQESEINIEVNSQGRISQNQQALLVSFHPSYNAIK